MQVRPVIILHEMKKSGELGSWMCVWTEQRCPQRHLSFSLIWTLKVVSIGRGLQVCAVHVQVFTGLRTWLEEVGHEEDLQETSGNTVTSQVCTEVEHLSVLQQLISQNTEELTSPWVEVKDILS